MATATTGQETALRKRQQIAKANRTMFLWVAAISAIFGIAIVVSIFLFQKALFNEKVLSEKSKTASTLVASNKAVGELKDQIRVLNTNQALKDSMISGETDPVQVVLDALPSEANSAALGASLQKKFLDDPALSIDTFVVDPVPGVESSGDDSTADTSDDGSAAAVPDGASEITFHFTVIASDANAFKSLLQRLESSIRAIDLTSVTVESQGEGKLALTVEGRAFYQPAKTVELKDKTVKP